jgi:hypothetical protein
MSPADRQKLLADVKVMDENAMVTLNVSSATLGTMACGRSLHSYDPSPKTISFNVG